MSMYANLYQRLDQDNIEVDVRYDTNFERVLALRMHFMKMQKAIGDT